MRASQECLQDSTQTAAPAISDSDFCEEIKICNDITYHSDAKKNPGVSQGFNGD